MRSDQRPPLSSIPPPSPYAPPTNPLEVPEQSVHRRLYPLLFLILTIPFGVCTGYVSVTLGSLLQRDGVSVGQIAQLGALGAVPHTLKFFWSPVADVSLTPKKWYLIACALTAAGVAAMGFVPATNKGLSTLAALVFLSSLASTVIGMTVDSLMAHCTPEHMKGRAGGWSSAGNLGGAGVGGGLGLFLTEWIPEWAASSIVGGMCALCCLALAGLPPPELSHRSARVVASVWNSLKDLWSVVRKRGGAIAFVLCGLPLGAAAASGLWSALAPEWQASVKTVALVNGLLGGIVSAIGCVTGGWLCDRMDRKSAYAWFGVLQAGAAVAMALLPRTPAMFIMWTLVYAFTAGLGWAAFAAFILEAIGKGAAATKYTAFSSLGNFPIWYMTQIDGWAHDTWNTTTMLVIEAGLGIAGALVFLAMVKTLLPKKPAA